MLSWIKNTKASISILVGVGAFALIPLVRWALFEIDHQFANIGTAVCLLIGCIALSVAFFRTASSQLRTGALVGGFLLVVAGLSCFEFRGFTGELVPTFRWRFAPSPKARLFADTPSHRTSGSGIAEEAVVASFSQYLGDARTGVIDSPVLVMDWQSNPPKELWRVPVGAGWAGMCVANGKVWTLFQDEDREAIVCIELRSGRELYRRSFPGVHFEPIGGKGPRSTPSWFDGKVVFQTATGLLVCLTADSGEILWERNLLHLGFDNQSQSEGAIKWGRSGSPLVIDSGDLQLVILPLGGAVEPSAPENQTGRTLIAYDLSSGKEVWRGGRHQIAYASPSLFELDGIKQIVCVNEGYVSGHSLKSGKQLWETEWPSHSNADASVSQAVRIDANQILVSKGYASGSKVFRVHKTAKSDESVNSDADLLNEGTWTTEPVWNSHRILKTKLTSAVHVAGKLYGLSDGILECVDANTGERVWRKGRYGQGQCLVVNNHLLITSEMGQLLLVRMEDGEVLYKQSVLDGVCWNYPAVAGPFVLMRNGTEMVCFYSGSQWGTGLASDPPVETLDANVKQVAK